MGGSPLDHTRWLATLAESNLDLERIRAQYVFDPLDRETVLGLEHVKGEILHDRVTGERCTILAGTRKRLTTLPSAGGAGGGGVSSAPA